MKDALKDAIRLMTTNDKLCSYAVKIAQASNLNKDYDCGDCEVL